MAFQFNFTADDIEDASLKAQVGTLHGSTVIESPLSADPPKRDCVEVSLDDLIEALPPVISYTPIRIPATRTDEKDVLLPRRDLFDVRFQLLNNDGDDEENESLAQRELDFVDAPSDLVPGVYEGGLKSWECSVDLAAYLADTVQHDDIRGKRVLEIGCGTAIPSLYLLREAFSRSTTQLSERPTVFCLQDYNKSALELMTLPNIILTWCLSPAGIHRQAREEIPSSVVREERGAASLMTDETAKDDGRPDLEIELTPELLSEFKSSLTSLHITIRFFHGSWTTLAASFATTMRAPLESYRDNDPSRPVQEPSAFDIVLTSETIYRPKCLPSLLSLLYQASNPRSAKAASLCLVAAKVVYFGVGGGISEFLRALEEGNGWGKGEVETVWKEDRGVARQIMRLDWHANS